MAANSEILHNYQLKNNFELVELAYTGVEARVVFELAQSLDVPKEYIADLLDTTVKTLQRQLKGNTYLNTFRGEHVLRLIGLFRHGEGVFGSVAVFKEWLTRPSVGLGNKKPSEIIKTGIGIDLVDDELTRIEFGDLA